MGKLAGSNLAPFFIFPLIFAGLFWESLFKGGIVAGGDFLNFQLVFLNFLKTTILNAQPPFWNPYIGGGIPMTLFSPIFYPINFLYLFLNLNWFLIVFYFSHFIIATFGMYFLARSFALSKFSAFFSAIIFVLAGYFSLRVYLGHTDLVAAISWIPLQFYLVSEYFRFKKFKFLFFLSLPISAQLLTGHFQISYYSLIFITAFFVFKVVTSYKEDKNLVVILPIYLMAVVFGIGIASPSWLPSLASIPDTTRDLPLTLSEVASFSQSLNKLQLAIFPWPFQRVLPSEGINFIGLFPLFLATLGFLVSFKKYKEVWFFLFIIIISLLISVGTDTPFFKLLYDYLPGFSSMRAHTRSLIFVNLGIAFLAGCGSDFILKKLPVSRHKYFSNFWLVLLLGTAAFILIFAPVIKTGFPALTILFQKYYLNIYLPSLGFILLILILFAKKLVNLFVLKTFFVLIIIANFYSFDWDYLKPANYEIPLKSDQEIATFIKEQDPQNLYRVWVETGIEEDYLPRSLNLAQFSVYEANNVGWNWQPKAYLRLKEYRYLEKEDYGKISNNFPLDKKTLKLFNVGYIVSLKNNLADEEIKFLKSFEVEKNYGLKKYTIYVYSLEDPLPRFYLTEKPILKDNGISTVTVISNNIKIGRLEPSKIELSVSSPQETYLVFNELNFKGWEAKVDNVGTNIEEVNFGEKGVKLNKGNHLVRFKFEPPYWKLSLTITAISFFILSVLLIFSHFKKS